MTQALYAHMNNKRKKNKTQMLIGLLGRLEKWVGLCEQEWHKAGAV
jgi:hypothetical protein